MEFKLTLQPQPLAAKTGYRHKILLAGSCFAENMADLMARYQFDVLQNPNGILYNPVSIAQALHRALEGKEYAADELFYYNELWASWQHHGRFSHTDKAACLNTINNELRTAHNYLALGQRLVVTFGSAFVYRLKSDGQLVANCHKYPNKEFDKELLTVEEIVSGWKGFIDALQTQNSGLQIILTVSPVRYVRDGLVENNRSKAILIHAVHTLCDTFENVHYFPAYELVMDDLRDYRFFEADMVHPNKLAIEYVWEKFVECAFDEEVHAIYPQIKQLVSASEHRPFNAGTQSHYTFKQKQREKAEVLQQQYPFLNLKQLIGSFGNI